MTATRNAIAGAFAVVLSCGAVSAADDPDIVKAEVSRAADECRAKGGKPDTEAMVKAEDLTGRGGPDWIVDFAKLKCTGAANPFCGSGGCALQVFLWNGAEWKSAVSEAVRKYRVLTISGQRAIEVQTAGAACGKANFRTCRKTFRFDRDGLRAERSEQEWKDYDRASAQALRKDELRLNKKIPGEATRIHTAQAQTVQTVIETKAQTAARIAEKERRFEAEIAALRAESRRLSTLFELIERDLEAIRASRERGERIDARFLKALEQRHAELPPEIDALSMQLKERERRHAREQGHCCAQDRSPRMTDEARKRAQQEAEKLAQEKHDEKLRQWRAQERERLLAEPDSSTNPSRRENRQ